MAIAGINRVSSKPSKECEPGYNKSYRSYENIFHLQKLQNSFCRSTKYCKTAFYSYGSLNQSWVSCHPLKKFIIILKFILKPKLFVFRFPLANELIRSQPHHLSQFPEFLFRRRFIKILDKLRFDPPILEKLHGFPALFSSGVVIDYYFTHLFLQVSLWLKSNDKVV